MMVVVVVVVVVSSYVEKDDALAQTRRFLRSRLQSDIWHYLRLHIYFDC